MKSLNCYIDFKLTHVKVPTLANCKKYHKMYSLNPRLFHEYAEGNTTSIEIIFLSAYWWSNLGSR